jgi:hypothetical protein
MMNTRDVYQRPYDPKTPVICLDEKPVPLIMIIIISESVEQLPPRGPGEVMLKDCSTEQPTWNSVAIKRSGGWPFSTHHIKAAGKSLPGLLASPPVLSSASGSAGPSRRSPRRRCERGRST